MEEKLFFGPEKDLGSLKKLAPLTDEEQEKLRVEPIEEIRQFLYKLHAWRQQSISSNFTFR